MAPFSVLQFIRDQWSTLPDHDALKVDLSGKTIIVLGSNVGLGFEAAKHFSRMNPKKLIMAVRNEEKGNQALQEIRNATGYKGGEVWHVDLQDFSSISQFADRFKKEGGQLDIVVENAGIGIGDKDVKTKDGWERTLQTNHLGTTLFGLLLLPYLAKSKSDGFSPRLVVVSSEMHFFAKFSPAELEASHILNKLNDEKTSNMPNRYQLTKLFNIFYVRALASRLSPDNPLVVTAVNPGLCHSELARDARPPVSWVVALMKFVLARTTEAGSRNLVHAAVGKPGKRDFHGAYLNKCQVEEESDFSLSKKGLGLQDRIWNETVEVLTKVDPRVENIIQEYLQNTLPRAVQF